MPTLGVPMVKRGMGGPMNVLPIMPMVKSGMGGPMNVSRVEEGLGMMMPKGKLRDVMLSRVNEELRG